MSNTIEAMQRQAVQARKSLITTLCQSALNLNTVIQVGQGSVSKSGLNSLRSERDRIAHDLYELLKDDEPLFLVAVDGHKYVGEISPASKTVYFHAFIDMEQYGSWE